MSTTTAREDAHGHDHPAFLAHHFDSHEQQFDSGKLGMWAFLVTEIMTFAGLFCAYAVYRAMHPEIFVYADHFLDRKLGALNTCVLLISSFTAAWAVRAAQLGQKKLLTGLLAFTVACGGTFMVVKYFEYSHKFHDKLLWAKLYEPRAQVAAERAAEGGHGGGHEIHLPDQPEPRNVGTFFSIYFVMTGLHGLHVLIGMGVLSWLAFRAARGDFNAEYFGPVEFAALFWHLVDLIWIYLFPLLYLIH
ncbi:MAG: cytochrome c oxidase subunit 3 family protein [Candidatus Methylomirabilis sp.]|nr:cytochrome c oxidase subunit 3 family protein [Deltaproteobacteria bacterium]